MADFEKVSGFTGDLQGFSDTLNFEGVFFSLLQVTGTEIVFW